MATLFENLNTGETGEQDILTTSYVAQTFTPQIRHVLTEIKLYIWRHNTPGAGHVQIRTTDAAFKPSSTVLKTVDFDGDALQTSAAWETFSFGAEIGMEPGTLYAIVLYLDGGSGSDYVAWAYKSGSSSYTRGRAWTSGDSGASWVGPTGDMLFEDWGIIDMPAVPLGIGVVA